MVGLKTAQTAQWFGADDLDGTVQEERIYHMAGAETPQGLSPTEIVHLIESAGRKPVERDTLYNVVAEGGALPPSTPFRRPVSHSLGVLQ
jgi:aminodeoxyfutalosine synthase